MTLVEFLTARLDEDYDYAQRYADLDGGDYDRLVRDVEAKRAILEVYAEVVAEIRGAAFDDERLGSMRGTRAGLEAAIYALATVYSDHSSHNEAWRP